MRNSREEFGNSPRPTRLMSLNLKRLSQWTHLALEHTCCTLFVQIRFRPQRPNELTIERKSICENWLDFNFNYQSYFHIVSTIVFANHWLFISNRPVLYHYCAVSCVQSGSVFVSIENKLRCNASGVSEIELLDVSSAVCK